MSQIHIARTQGRNHEMLRFMFMIRVCIIKEKCCQMIEHFVKREFACDLGVAFLFHETCFNIPLSK